MSVRHGEPTKLPAKWSSLLATLWVSDEKPIGDFLPEIVALIKTSNPSVAAIGLHTVMHSPKVVTCRSQSTCRPRQRLKSLTYCPRAGSLMANARPPSTTDPPTIDARDRCSPSMAAPAKTPTTGIRSANGVT